MSKKSEMAAWLFGTGQAPVETHLYLLSDYLQEVDSTRTATTPIIISKAIHKIHALKPYI